MSEQEQIFIISVRCPVSAGQVEEIRARYLAGLAGRTAVLHLGISIHCPRCGKDVTGWAMSSQQAHHESHGRIDRLWRDRRGGLRLR